MSNSLDRVTSLDGSEDIIIISSDRTKKVSLPILSSVAIGPTGPQGSPGPIGPIGATGSTSMTTQTTTLSYVVKHGSKSEIDKYISLQSPIYWNDNFVQVFRYVDTVRTAVPFSQCVGVNTLDYTRVRSVNGQDDSAPATIINAIGLLYGAEVY